MARVIGFERVFEFERALSESGFRHGLRESLKVVCLGLVLDVI